MHKQKHKTHVLGTHSTFYMAKATKNMINPCERPRVEYCAWDPGHLKRIMPALCPKGDDINTELIPQSDTRAHLTTFQPPDLPAQPHDMRETQFRQHDTTALLLDKGR